MWNRYPTDGARTATDATVASVVSERFDHQGRAVPAVDSLEAACIVLGY